MKANENLIKNIFLTDVEGSEINAEESHEISTRSNMPYSNIGSGKFRKLFNRHHYVFTR